MSIIKRILHLARHLDHCPTQLPWFAFRGPEPIAELHRLVCHYEWPASFGAVCLFAVIWPILALVRISSRLLRDGPRTKHACGVGLWRQFTQLYRLALRLNLTTNSYYRFRLWRPENYARAEQYLQVHEAPQLMHLLGDNTEAEVLLDKPRFFAAARKHSLPVAEVLAAFRPGGEATWYSREGVLPQQDLFIKRADQWMGLGAERWEHQPTADCWQSSGRRLTAAQLVDHCRDLSSAGAVILQPRLRNHPALEPFSNGALCTLRVLTYRIPDYGSGVLSTTWRMPAGDGIIDNFSGGGIAAGVTPSGVLRQAITKDAAGGSFDRHPDTGQPITGTHLPMFREMVDLAETAHERFTEPYLVGWDVACTPAGCILLEGNWIWGIDAVQIPHDQPATALGVDVALLAACEVRGLRRPV